MDNFHNTSGCTYTLMDAIREIDRSRNIFLLEKKKEREILLGEVCRQLESLRMAVTRDRSGGGLEREKKFNYKHGETRGVRCSGKGRERGR